MIHFTDPRTPGFKSEHWTDIQDNPAGGVSMGVGFVISWQNGPLGTDKFRKEPNGAFVEDVISAVLDRISFYQASPFRCEENEEALTHLKLALEALHHRTAKREEKGVEGTHEL